MEGRRVRWLAGMVGAVGSVTCAGAMVLTLVGVGGAAAVASGRAAARSMAGMGASQGSAAGSGQIGGVLGFLNRIGPELLAVSAVLVTVSLALRRRVGALPAVLGGALLWWGMYEQSSTAVMDVTLVAGFLIWTLTYAWARGARRALSSGR